MLWVFFVRYAAFFVPVFQNHLTALSLLSFATPVFDRLPQEILHNLCNLPRPVLPFLLLFCTKNPICFCADHRVPKNFSVILFAKSPQKWLTRTFKRYIIRKPKFFKESPEPIPPILSGFLRYITDIWRVTDFTFHKKDFFRYNASTNQGERSF